MQDFNEKFKEMEYKPFTRQQMIDCIEGKGAPRPGVAIGTWIHLDLLSKDKQDVLKELFKKYPEDMQEFYVKKPSVFGEPGDKYTWCDVENADPSIGRTTTVGVDEETAISWEVYDQISKDVPDIEEPDMFCHAPEPDGRYRLAWLSGGPWTRIWTYRGMTNSMMDLYMNPQRVHDINRRVIRFFKAAAKRGVKEAGIDAIGFGDDLGMQKGPFMSKEMFREFYFPYYKELCDYAHSLGLHVWMHCCGDAMMLIDQLIEAGIDVLHPIQKYALDEKKVVDTFGDQLSFWVGMDLQRILPFGTKEDVIKETQFLIDTFYTKEKGRTIFTVNNRLEDNVPIENVVAFIEEAYRYGTLKGAERNE